MTVRNEEDVMRLLDDMKARKFFGEVLLRFKAGEMTFCTVEETYLLDKGCKDAPATLRRLTSDTLQCEACGKSFLSIPDHRNDVNQPEKSYPSASDTPRHLR